MAIRRRSNSRPDRGLGLAESILTLALLGLVLSIFALVVKTMTTHSSGLERKDDLVTANLTGLERLARDARMAVIWQSPARNQAGVVSSLEFDLPDYENDATRLPPYTPGTLATPPWNPLNTTLRVRYRVLNSELLREVFTGGVYQGIPVAFKVAGLAAQRTGRAELHVTLSVDPSPRPIQQLSRLIHLPQPQSWRQP